LKTTESLNKLITHLFSSHDHRTKEEEKQDY